MAKRISVVISQTPSQNPAKRALEEEIVTHLLMQSGVEVTIIPNLYDLTADSTGMLALKSVPGDMIVLSWMFPRAAHWILDRNAVNGRVGETLLSVDDDDDDDELEALDDEEEKVRVIDQRPAPSRSIYCLDLRSHNTAEPYLQEVRRIVDEANTEVVSLMGWIKGSPQPEQLDRYLNGAVPGANGNGNGNATNGNATNGSAAAANGSAGEAPAEPAVLHRIEDAAPRRWYPVIDFSRCTNCMECVDFCLFGVYGVDGQETILVEQPDNCRKGCPACSRVCPENAIIFPQHKTPAIAGSDDAVAGLKIDLSQLFGAPSTDDGGVDVAVRERDEQLLLAGREAVGSAVGLPKRQQDQDEEPKDELDSLLDELDDLDL
ncbi:ATP-binding protein [Lignipirellula cremea]|uniref:4Fe-4S binding domain protein n=1 Tax=Lignipirellula cremea TaxID=2528010 RepID=A0A518E2L3_9BACT|nr:ferredoxin family protein [Lignipirellula cremea]QDU98327.1 4Fe-4S binding domain protein [Lignipirellula cremea]